MLEKLRALFRPKEPASRAPFSGPKEGWVSVWIGDYVDEMDFDGYSVSEFEADHGAPAFYEGSYTVFPEPVPFDVLFEKSWVIEPWRELVREEFTKQGIERASFALTRVHYQHVPARPGKGPLRFVTSVQFDATTSP